ncbi:MAG: sigma-70 family RNA polymerase sigma factor [Gemmataceae bacterium]
MTDADSVLAERAKAGDRAAFEELVRRTGRLVFARLYLDTGDPHRADDIAQDTYLLAWRQLRTLHDPTGFRPWLLTIAHRAMLDAARRTARRARLAPPAAAGALDTVHAAGADPEQAARQEEARRAVLEALRSLPDEYRLPLSLRYLAGADYDAIGTQLGLTNGSLRGLLHRGLKLLRERLPASLGSDEPA